MSFGSYGTLIFGAWALATVYTLYQETLPFRAVRCGSESARGCLSPLMKEREPVDFYLYLTTNSTLRWWSKEGVENLLRAPLWNATGIPLGDPLEAVLANISLSAKDLGGVRRNESTLIVHCFLLRSGTDLLQAVSRFDGPQALDSGPSVDVLDSNVMHAQANITRLLPQLVKPRRNLLANASKAQSGSGSSGDAEGDARGGANSGLPAEDAPVFQRLPVLGTAVPVYPSEALMWVGSAFCVTAFLEPGPVLAVARQTLGVAVAPWLVQLRRWQQEEQQAARLEAAAASRQVTKEVSTPHLAPLVRISLAADSESYDARYRPPLLYKKVVIPKGAPFGQILHEEVRYPVLGGSNKRYAPALAVDLAGLKRTDWRPLAMNASAPDPAVTIEVEVKGMVHYSLVQTMREYMEIYKSMGFTEQDLEEVGEFLFRYPLHIMVFMQVIGFLQMSLTTLAFKNDVSFFKGRSDYTGLSSRSLGTDTLQEIIIFFYLLDFDNISRILLFQWGVGALISAWKFARVAQLSVYWAYFLPWVRYGRASAVSSSEKDTEDIDVRGMAYLKMVLYPLSVVWGLYSLYHYSYKSWWSWLISSMADFAYTFGFINMMPQIFINYKLKSVAHMPWRVLMYKFFNTFIDDVFAFFIMSEYMSKKHRFMTLRDDIVFFIFLYQLWIYKVDPNRPDEFGFVYVQEPVRRTLELTFVDVSLSLDDVEAFRRELDLAWLEAGVGEETVRGLATQVLAGEAAEPKASVAAVVQVGGPADSIGELCNLLDNGRVEIRGVRPRWTEQENAAGPGGPTGGKTGPLAPVPSAEGPAELAPSPAGAPAGAPAPAR